MDEYKTKWKIIYFLSKVKNMSFFVIFGWNFVNILTFLWFIRRIMFFNVTQLHSILAVTLVIKQVVIDFVPFYFWVFINLE